MNEKRTKKLKEMIKSLFIVNCANDILCEKHYDKVLDKGVLVPFYDKRLFLLNTVIIKKEN